MKNPIAPNTKIRILSPEHANYVQRLSKDAGFKPFLTDMSINLPWVAFHYDMDFTCNKSIGAYGELKEIFIDLPTEAELDQAASDMLNYSNDLLDKSGAKEAIDNIMAGQNPVTPKHSHYFKDVSDLDEVDVYRACDLFEVNDNSGAIQHALKKLLCSGQRGAKGYRKDLEEARDSIQRKLDLMAEDGE